MSRRGLDPQAEAAIDWAVRMSSGEATAADHQALQAWLLDPLHQRLWEQVQGLLQGPVEQLNQAETRQPGQLQAATRALRSNGFSARRRRLLGAGGALAMLLGVGLSLAQRLHPLADLRTATGERRRVDLPDGSRLLLNAESAVDLRFDANQRRVRLLRGELLVSVAADAGRPFIVETRDGTVRALGTRFMVAQAERDSLVLVQEHSVEVRTRYGQQAVVASGEALRFASDALSPAPVRGDPAAWAHGQLEISDAPLDEVLDALRPYLSGYLHVTPEAARLRVFGVFPLDDSERTLRALADGLPIEVKRYGPVLLVAHTTQPLP